MFALLIMPKGIFRRSIHLGDGLYTIILKSHYWIDLRTAARNKSEGGNENVIC